MCLFLKRQPKKVLLSKNAGAHIGRSLCVSRSCSRKSRKQTVREWKEGTEKAGGRDNLSITVTNLTAEDRQETFSFLGLHDSGLP